MKLVKVLMLMLMSITLVNCGKDDEPTPSYDLTVANLEGTYSMSSFSGSNKLTTITDGNESVVTTTLSADTIELEITFNSDGTFDVDEETESYRLITTVDGSDDFDIITIVGGTYSLNTINETITLSSTSIELDGTYNVDEFTSELLTISKSEEENDSGVVGGVTITTKEEETETFEFTK